MITCFIRYFVNSKKLSEFEQYARIWVPLIEKYGGKVGFTDGGYHLGLPGKHAHDIAAELCARGNIVEESVDDIPEWISYYYGEIDPRVGRARAAQPASPLG